MDTPTGPAGFEELDLLPLASNLDLLKEFTLSQDVIRHRAHGGLDGAAACLEVTSCKIIYTYANA